MPGPRSAYVGLSATEQGAPKIHFNLDKLSTHTMVAGATGSGKTVAAQVIIEEALLKGISVVVFDPTAQWTGFLRPQKSDEMLSSFGTFGIGKNEAQSFKGAIRVPKTPFDQAELKEAMKPGQITIYCLNKLKQKPGEHADLALSEQKLRETAQTLNKMDAMLDYLRKTSAHQEGSFLTNEDPSELEQFIINSVHQVFDANLEEKQELKMLFVYDEVHRLLPKFGGSGQGFRQIERAVREFRKWGIGLVLVSQVLSDFVGEIKANIGTEVQMRTKYEGDLDRVKLKFGEEFLQAVVRLPIGIGMAQNSDYNKGIPFFVAFRPLLHNTNRLSDDELSKYEAYDKKISEYEKTLAQADSTGASFPELKVELSLAREKLANGSFPIVDIYLDGLAPKFEKLQAKNQSQ